MLKRVSSAILMIFVLLGTIGMNYSAHYCGGELIKSGYSFIPQQLTCGMKKISRKVNDDGNSSVQRLCCENELLTFQLEDDYDKYGNEVPVTGIVGSIPVSLLESTTFLSCNKRYEFIGYSPPPLERNILVLYQTFLI